MLFYVTRKGADGRGEIAGTRGCTFNQKIELSQEAATHLLRIEAISPDDQEKAEAAQKEAEDKGREEAKKEADKQAEEIKAAKEAARKQAEADKAKAKTEK